MAFRAGRYAQLSVNSVDLSAYCDSIELSVTPGTTETTTFGSTWQSHIATLIGATLTASGFYDPTTTTGPQDALWAVITGLAPVACVHKPGGTASGQRTNSFNALISDYSEQSDVGEKVAFSFSLLVTGAVTPTTQ